LISSVAHVASFNTIQQQLALDLSNSAINIITTKLTNNHVSLPIMCSIYFINYGQEEEGKKGKLLQDDDQMHGGLEGEVHV
jgi:hypothetical protein